MDAPASAALFTLTRRGFLGRIAPALAAVAVVGLPFRPRLAAAGELLETPSDDEGPFYREGAPARSDMRRKDSTTFPMALSGLVRAEDGKALPGVTLDLWQADSGGHYDNDSREFRYRGKIVTDKDGRFRFDTNVPGQYSLGGGQKRPKHVHVKLSGAGLYDLTTQMYFDVRPGVDVAEELFVPLQWTGEGQARSATGAWNPILSRKPAK